MARERQFDWSKNNIDSEVYHCPDGRVHLLKVWGRAAFEDDDELEWWWEVPIDEVSPVLQHTTMWTACGEYFDWPEETSTP